MKVGILSNESAIWQTLCTKMALKWHFFCTEIALVSFYARALSVILNSFARNFGSASSILII